MISTRVNVSILVPKFKQFQKEEAPIDTKVGSRNWDGQNQTTVLQKRRKTLWKSFKQCYGSIISCLDCVYWGVLRVHPSILSNLCVYPSFPFSFSMQHMDQQCWIKFQHNLLSSTSKLLVVDLFQGEGQCLTLHAVELLATFCCPCIGLAIDLLIVCWLILLISLMCIGVTINYTKCLWLKSDFVRINS